MTKEEYSLLFHREQLNLVAFKRLMDCDEEVLRLVNKAIEKEREACAKMAENRVLIEASDIEKIAHYTACKNIASGIRARGQA